MSEAEKGNRFALRAADVQKILAKVSSRTIPVTRRAQIHRMFGDKAPFRPADLSAVLDDMVSKGILKEGNGDDPSKDLLGLGPMILPRMSLMTELESGSPVWRLTDLGVMVPTFTASGPWKVSDLTSSPWLVKVRDMAGGYSLERIYPRVEPGRPRCARCGLLMTIHPSGNFWECPNWTPVESKEKDRCDYITRAETVPAAE